MAPPRRGGLFASPRHLTHRHVRRALRKEVLSAQGTTEQDEAATKLEKLISFHLPSLQGGRYEIEINQVVETSAGEKPTKPLKTVQEFKVLVPRFSLPDGIRAGSHRTKDKDYSRNKTPWLAVLSFTEDELKLPPSDASGGDNIFNQIKSLEKGVQQTPTLGVKGVPVAELGSVRKTVTPITYDKDVDGADAHADVILVKRQLFQALFSQSDKSGKAVATSTPYVYHHRYLAHERIVNTQGMAMAGAASDEDDQGTFGVIVSHRGGPSNISAPTAVHVHLVSIEGVEDMGSWPIAGDIQYVALSSLHSWTYTCLPPSSRTLYDDLVDLGKSVGLLRPVLSKETEAKLQATMPAGPCMLARLMEGFSMSRYRTQTGEMTASFLQGPLVSCDVKLPDWWHAVSMTGQDLQFLDRALGIMDLSYSAAWQLGRSMAMADAAFTTALVRIRREILHYGSAEATSVFMKAHAGYKSKTDVLSSLERTLAGLDSLDDPEKVDRKAMSARWCHASRMTTAVDLSYHGPIVDSLIDGSLRSRAKWVAGAYDADSPTWASDPPRPYNEYNTPNSPDWVVLQRWILDRKLLMGIPSHYLVTDASHLPWESVRFFQLDDAWMDSFVDGALSLGNHVDQDEDKVRNVIRDAINDYLKAELPGIDAHPPTPKYRCYVRSGIVKKFPDLIATVLAAENVTPAMLVRHSILDEGIMLCLFSEVPNKSNFTGLSFTQPPHQQTFIAGRNLTETDLTMEYRRAYTDKCKARCDKGYREPVSKSTWHRGQPDEHRGTGFLWEVPSDSSLQDPSPVSLRAVHMENLAEDYREQLVKYMPPGAYKDEIASSALVGYQLSEPAYALHIEFQDEKTNSSPSSHAPSVGRDEPHLLPVTTRVAPPIPPAPAHQVHRSGPIETTVGDMVLADRRPRTTPGHVPAPTPTVRYARALPDQFSPSMRAAIDELNRRQRKQYQDLLRKGLLGMHGLSDSEPQRSGPVHPNGYPYYEYWFWSADAPGKPGRPGCVSMRKGEGRDGQVVPLAQDIIFSISLPGDGKPGTYKPVVVPGALMDRNADGSGPRATMLRNLRFNPRVSYDADGKHMSVTLWPRGSKSVPARRAREMSLLLSGVRVNVAPPGIDQVVVTPTVSIKYEGWSLQPPSQMPPPSMTLCPDVKSKVVVHGGREQ
ncbi:hypothetical protein V8C34DRAFT_320028 [Trichoderma compactum]